MPGESDADLLVVPKGNQSLDDFYDVLNPVFESLLDKGVVLHIIIYQKGMERLLEEARKGIRIL